MGVQIMDVLLQSHDEASSFVTPLEWGNGLRTMQTLGERVSVQLTSLVEQSPMTRVGRLRLPFKGSEFSSGPCNGCELNSLPQTIRYARSPLALFSDTTFRPSFFLIAPEIAPRTVWASQPVDSMT